MQLPIRYSSSSNTSAGFSLIEMSVVLVLAGILLTLGMGALSLHQDYSALSTTQRRMETVKDSLIAYLRENRRLPCPENATPPSGRETRDTPNNAATRCRSYVGTLPWLNLGLPKETVMDGFGHFFTYYVSSSMDTSEPDWTLTSNIGSSTPGFSTGNPGRFAITEGDAQTVLVGNMHIPPLAAVVLVSHGKNGLGAIAAKGTRIDNAGRDDCELANIPTGFGVPPVWPGISTTLRAGRGTGCASMDDIVMPLRPNDLLMPIIKDGAMKSAQAVTQEALMTVRVMAIEEMLSNACVPKPVLSLPLPSDGWGSPINYLAGTSSNMRDFSLWSSGPNRVNDNGFSDDVTLATGKVVTYLVQIRPPFQTLCP